MNDPDRLQARQHPPARPAAVSGGLPAQRPGLHKLPLCRQCDFIFLCLTVTTRRGPLRYREFDGGHAIPPEIAQEAVDWLMAGRPAEEG
jgi:hypothetical protein